MKKELKIVVGLAIALILVALIILTKSHISYIKLEKVTSAPFSTIEILEQKIRLKDNERTYNTEIDCTQLKSSNDQIVYYRFNEKYKDSSVSVSSKVFSGDTITSDYKNITAIEVNLSIKDPKNQYEQIYHINATCHIDETQKEEDEEKPVAKTDDNNKTKKKSKK